MNDNTLTEITDKIDITLHELLVEYKLPPLYLCAIALARLTLVCDEVGSGGDFRLLASELPPPLQNEVVH